jgi:hypothetical protein
MKQEIESITKVLEQNKTKILDKSSRILKAKELGKILDKMGFEFVGSGLSREVYTSKDKSIVVKLEVNDTNEPFNQNKQEVENWLKASSELKRFLLPILVYADDYSWLIMPYAEDIEDSDESIKFKDELMKNDIYYTDFGHSNVGLYKGEYVIRDYGYGNSKDWIRKVE